MLSQKQLGTAFQFHQTEQHPTETINQSIKQVIMSSIPIQCHVKYTFNVQKYILAKTETDEIYQYVFLRFLIPSHIIGFACSCTEDILLQVSGVFGIVHKSAIDQSKQN